tara:strand:+ start:4668 stop:4958 length:291 start_codon:yes stop_codon:yes gene_type:complete
MVMQEEIERRLRKTLNVAHLEIQDDSAQHAGHTTNPHAGGHFTALLVSKNFEKLNLLERHRLVYDALGNLMGKEIHAFSMKTLTPGENDRLKKDSA